MADRSVFNGYSITLYRSDGSIAGSWPAISGRGGNQKPSDQNLPFQGPLTEGSYSFSTSDIQPLRTLDAAIGLLPRSGRFPGLWLLGAQNVLRLSQLHHRSTVAAISLFTAASRQDRPDVST
jgi:hypothetical protein